MNREIFDRHKAIDAWIVKVVESARSGVRSTVAQTPVPLDRRVMHLFHATTQKKAKLYRQTGAIKSPVRGFSTMSGAMAWAMKVGRTVILEFDAGNAHKLPDHHNAFGEAWWNDGDITNWRCVFSANGDA